jgi:2-keto-4-pentenoate hydratase
MTVPDDPRIARGMKTQLEARRDKLAAGERPLGWKVGFGSAAAMERLKIKTPLVGFLLAGGRVADGAAVSLAGWTKAMVEPEIAVHMGKDLAGGADEATARAAIAALGPSFELIDLDVPPADPEAVLACNIYQRGVVVGAPDKAYAGARLDGLTARISRRGADIATVTDTNLEANTGKLIDNVRQVADTLAASGETLRAGEIIIIGSLVPPIAIDGPGDEIGFELAPIGRVTVRFEK